MPVIYKLIGIACVLIVAVFLLTNKTDSVALAANCTLTLSTSTATAGAVLPIKISSTGVFVISLYDKSPSDPESVVVKTNNYTVDDPSSTIQYVLPTSLTIGSTYWVRARNSADWSKCAPVNGISFEVTDSIGPGEEPPEDPGEDPASTGVVTPLPGLKAAEGGDVNEVATGFASRFLSFGIGIGGGIAFLLMIFGAYRLIFAGGNPDAIQQGREIITAAIAGLLVIVFAMFILRFLGLTILGLGGL